MRKDRRWPVTKWRVFQVCFNPFGQIYSEIFKFNQIFFQDNRSTVIFISNEFIGDVNCIDRQQSTNSYK